MILKHFFTTESTEDTEKYKNYFLVKKTLRVLHALRG